MFTINTYTGLVINGSTRYHLLILHSDVAQRGILLVVGQLIRRPAQCFTIRTVLSQNTNDFVGIIATPRDFCISTCHLPDAVFPMATVRKLLSFRTARRVS